jgi:Domain of unknown function DUF29
LREEGRGEGQRRTAEIGVAPHPALRAAFSPHAALREKVAGVARRMRGRSKMSDAYETDFYAWAMEQAALLRAGRFAAADISNIAEEIESLARGEKRELVNRLTILLLHLLKWQFQPGFRSASRSSSIREQRIRLRSHLNDNPSLKAKLDESFAEAYELAVIGAPRETGLPDSDFPKTAPYRFEQAADDGFWP